MIRLVVVKELTEILRDRRTLFLMMGIPIFLYPALFVLMEQVLLFGQGALGNVVPRVAVHRMAYLDQPLPLSGREGLEIVALQGADGDDVLSGRFDAVMVIDSTGSEDVSGLTVHILYDASRDRSNHARSLLVSQLESVNREVLSDRLERFGLPPDFARPVSVRDTSVATPRGLGGATLGRFLPMVLILMTVLGAFHPAIDVAAGERERRTLEPLLSTSAPGSMIVIGKYLAVAVIAFNTAALNLVSMLLTLRAGIFQFAAELGLEFELPARAVLLILALLALLALLFSALFIGVAIHAQSFREAQTSLTPIYLVSFLPAIVVMAPGIEFSMGLALIPISGVALLFRSLMAGDPVGIEAFVAVGATIAYSALALSFAARAFEREDVLLGDDEDAEVGSRRRGVPWWNRDASAIPTPRVAMLFVAMVGILYFYIGVGFSRWGERGLLASQWLLLALPTLALLRFGHSAGERRSPSDALHRSPSWRRCSSFSGAFRWGGSSPGSRRSC
jgi:sodium transport system permease protein